MTEHLVTLIGGLRAEALELETQAFHRFPSDREGAARLDGQAHGLRRAAERLAALLPAGTALPEEVLFEPPGEEVAPAVVWTSPDRGRRQRQGTR